MSNSNILYCSAPFGQLRLKYDSQNICCKFPNMNYSKDKNNYYHTEEFDKIRNDIINEDISNLPNECKYCNSRLSILNCGKYTKESSENVYRYLIGEKIKIFRLNLSLGNRCNQACKMCDRSSSSNIILPDDNIYNYSMYLDEDMSLANEIIDDNKDDIKHISFVGGETFLYEKELISILEKTPNVESIDVCTNGSIFPKKLVGLLHDKNIHTTMAFSIDGTRKTNPYIRGYSKYDEIIENIKMMSKYDNINIRINITISILNCLELDSVVSDIRKYINIDKDITIAYNIVHEPTYFSVVNLSTENKNKIINKIKSIKDSEDSVFIDSDSKKEFLDYMIESNPINIWNRKELIRVIEHHDKHFNFNTIDYINGSIMEEIYGNEKK